MIRILYVLHSCPYPPNKGDRIRSFNIIKYLSKYYDLRIIYPCFSGHNYENENFLLKYCSYVESVKIGTVWAKIRCLLGFICGKSLTYSYFKSKKIEKSIENIEYDIALVDCSSMYKYIIDKDVPKIIDFVDVDSEKWKLFGEISRFPKSYIYNREYRKLKKIEEEVVEKFDECIVISDQEKLSLNKDKNVSVIKNGIDFEYFNNKNNISLCNDKYIVFSGAMNYFPNIDGALFFSNFVFPQIKKKMSDIKFVIAGMSPPRKIKKLESEDIIITGFVEDIRTFISNASVCVVPLRIARGIQNKILEAMAMGVPVVSTSLANNGINAINGKEIFIADDAEEFARLIIELINNKKLREQIIENANSFVKKNFDWDHNLKDLNTIISLAGRQNYLKNQDCVICR